MEASKTAGYSLPSRETISEAIMDILNEATTVRSQRRFHRLVLSKLQETTGPDIRLSEIRLRRIAARMDRVELIIHCREGQRRSGRSNCPVCSAPMENIRNSTLYGWTVSTGKSCPVCGYWTGHRQRIPIRYVFTIEKEKYLREKMNGKVIR
ncbi:MAG: hypothetical protein R6V01_00890 [Thermoplasmatota archaeon]